MFARVEWVCGSVLVVVGWAGMGEGPLVPLASPLHKLEGRLYVLVGLSPNVSCHLAGL